ncbi:MAG: SpoIID/LytB domain-containing protein [Oliverpabstia sp.]|nr:SpoIID/LytB domain-containing protein [Lachnospiraceae bacterium]MDY5027732.1 SpoIID/LytB domain-containing protein [Oliverpabstia sp.]
MKHQTGNIMLAILGMLLLPLGFTALISGKDAIEINKQMDMEVYLPMMLCREIPWGYEEEMLKAQAVLIRSSLYLRLENKELDQTELKENLENYKNNSQKEQYQMAYKRMEKAVNVTKGQVISYQGEICSGVFHRVSAGQTREGSEVLQDTKMSFLMSVDSSQDIQSEDYLHGHYFTEEALKDRLLEIYPDIELSDQPLTEQIVVEKRDSQEYVLEIRVGSLTVPGEEFRNNLELSSSNFTVQNLDGKIRFLCKGLGHGLGMSQYGGNELAKEGKTYEQIIFTYFPDVILKKIPLSL